MNHPTSINYHADDIIPASSTHTTLNRRRSRSRSRHSSAGSNYDKETLQSDLSNTCQYEETHPIASNSEDLHQFSNVVNRANVYCNVFESDGEHYHLDNLSRNTSVCQSQVDIASYGSFTSLGRARKSPSSSCSMHHDHINHSHHTHHRRRSSVVSRSKTCPHHNRRRKYSTSCSTLHGSIKLEGASHCNSHHGSTGSVFELPQPPNESPPPPVPPHATHSSFNGNGNAGAGHENGHNIVLTPSKVTIEHNKQENRSKGATFQKTNGSECSYEGCTYVLPDYAQSPSPIKWNFVAAGDGDPHKNESQNPVINLPTTSDSSTTSPSDQQLAMNDGHCNDNAQMVSMWQTMSNAGELNSTVVDNCCNHLNNYHCDHSGDDYDVSVSEAELNEFFGKGSANRNHPASHHQPSLPVQQRLEPYLNNAIEIESHPTIDILNRNDISAVINQLNLSPEFREYGKSSNINQNPCNLTPSRITAQTQAKSNVCNSNFWLNQNTDNNHTSVHKFSNMLPQPLPHTSLNSESSQFNNVSDSYEPLHISARTTLNTNRNNATFRNERTTEISLTTQNHFDTSSSSSARQNDESFYDLIDQESSLAGAAAAAWSSDVTFSSATDGLDTAAHPTVAMSRFQTGRSRLGGLFRVVRNRTKKSKNRSGR